MTISFEKQKSIEEKMKALGLYEEDIEESFIRSGGAGGQKVNKSSSCVRLVHRPSGIEVKCQIARSQTDNRYFARRILCDKYQSQILKVKSDKDRETYRIRKQKKKRSRRAKEKMLKDKKVHGNIKTLRKSVRNQHE